MTLSHFFLLYFLYVLPFFSIHIFRPGSDCPPPPVLDSTCRSFKSCSNEISLDFTGDAVTVSPQESNDDRRAGQKCLTAWKNVPMQAVSRWDVLCPAAGCRATEVRLGDERRLRPLREPGGQWWSGQHLHSLQHQGRQPQDPQGAGRAHR